MSMSITKLHPIEPSDRIVVVCCHWDWRETGPIARKSVNRLDVGVDQNPSISRKASHREWVAKESAQPRAHPSLPSAPVSVSRNSRNAPAAAVSNRLNFRRMILPFMEACQ
jgi:hypothetical protein